MIRTRFAPSPTGYLHIGGVRTALFAWAYAKKLGGDFILRIEDTDLERSSTESVKVILDGMHWLGLDYNQGPYYQTKRLKRYQEVIQILIDSGHAYYCYCSKKELHVMREKAESNGGYFTYDRSWRPESGKILPPVPDTIQPVVRFKMPLVGITTWHDVVKGTISFENSQLDDLIIARSDGVPTYNLCVVVDDYDMQITHVIRGDDHVNNTPKQINIFKALRGAIPAYAHVPLILNENGGKMSKRHNAVSIRDYNNLGILPHALLNYLARLGWSHQNDEFFSIAQFIQWFDLKDVHPSASRFNMEKLFWLNAEHIKCMDLNQLAVLMQHKLHVLGIQEATINHLIPILQLVRGRVNNLNDLAQETIYFYRKKTPTAQEMQKFWDDEAKVRLARFAEQLKTITESDWTAENIRASFKPWCHKEGIHMSKLGMPLRLQICGTSKTPSIDAVLAILGKKEVLQRIEQS